MHGITCRWALQESSCIMLLSRPFSQSEALRMAVITFLLLNWRLDLSMLKLLRYYVFLSHVFLLNTHLIDLTVGISAGLKVHVARASACCHFWSLGCQCLLNVLRMYVFITSYRPLHACYLRKIIMCASASLTHRARGLIQKGVGGDQKPVIKFVWPNYVVHAPLFWLIYTNTKSPCNLISFLASHSAIIQGSIMWEVNRVTYV